MNQKVLFTAEEDDKLVEIVAKFPCIYDVTSSGYKDQLAKDNCWKEIAEFTERSAEDCKKRWRNIKDTYIKKKKKIRGSAPASSKGRKWPLCDMLTFLDKADYNYENICNIQCDTGSIEEHDVPMTENHVVEKVDDAPSSIQNITDISIQNAEPTRSLLPPPSKRQKHNEKILQLLEARRAERQELIKQLTQNRDDEIDLFFKSIAMSIKKLTPELINEAKLKSLQMVFDLENRAASQLNFSSSSTTNNSLSPASSNVPISSNSSVCDAYDFIIKLLNI